MPNTHDGHEISPATPPPDGLSYSTGSLSNSIRSILPIRPAVHLVLAHEGAQSPATLKPRLTDPERLERIGRSVWQANKYFMDAPEIEILYPDVPQWLAPVPPPVVLPCEDDDMPLRYGIQFDAESQRIAPVTRMDADIFEYPVKVPVTRALLHFPLGSGSLLPRVHVLPTIRLDDGVLPFRAPDRQTTAVFSLIGGVGVTSIAAGLARLLAGSGLRVLLADTCAHSLISRLFGARDVRQGVIRNFYPATGDRNRMISLVSLAVDAFAGDDCEQYRILEEFAHDAASMDRVVWDLSGAPLDWSAKVLGTAPQILVPLLPSMSSLVQLRATQRFIHRCHDEDPAGHLNYVMNRFDESDRQHVETSARFRQLLGDQMLRVTLRRSPLVDEALARGKTVVDHAPQSPVVGDLWKLARQLNHFEARAGAELHEGTPSAWFEH